MINSFNKFRDMLILEACLSAHEDLLNRLSKIAKDSDRPSEIAREIVDYISDEEWLSPEDIKQDFFNVTNANDKLSFIQSNRVSSEPYTSSKRGELKIGRALRYICGLYDIDVTDKDIEDLVNRYKSVSDDSEDTFKFKFLIGQQIIYGYDTNNYSSNRGALGDSCMNDESSYFDIYTDNKDKVRLLVLENDGKIFGRALVWKLDKSPCDAEYFMDRVYTNYDYHVNTFIEYAKSNGWMYKKKMSYGNDEAVRFIYNNQDVFGEIRVSLNGDFDEYPFLDTIPFLSRKKDELSNIPSRRCYILRDTCGDRERCYSCNGRMKNNRLCGECAQGVVFLKKKGIITDVERNRKKKK